MNDTVIKADNIKKSFSGKEVLKDVSFEIHEAEIVGLYGDSGSGKSTLANIILGLTSMDMGSMTKLSSKVQIAWQQPALALDPKERVIDGICELLIHLKICKNKKEAKVYALDYSGKFGIENILSHYPHQLSGGEAQRVCIAKAMLFKPKLLILDEATSMLDVLTQKEIIGLVKDLVDKEKTSILFISHDKKLLNHICNRIYILERGELYEENNK